MKYRKKPIEIEAYRVGDLDQPVPLWVRQGITFGNAVDYAEISTLEGTMRANRGDWIIRGIKGELYPCKPDIFEATYEAVEEKAQDE